MIKEFLKQEKWDILIFSGSIVIAFIICLALFGLPAIIADPPIIVIVLIIGFYLIEHRKYFRFTKQRNQKGK